MTPVFIAAYSIFVIASRGPCTAAAAFWAETTRLYECQETHMSGVAVWNASGYHILYALLKTLRRYGEQHTRTGTNPNEIAAGQQRRDTQTGSLVLAYNLITIRKHFIHSWR